MNYVIEYSADPSFSKDNVTGDWETQSRQEAEQFYNGLTRNNRVQWARWYRKGQAGSIGAYYRD